MRHILPLILLASTALAGVASADANTLRDTALEQFKPLPSTIPAVKDNPVTPRKDRTGQGLVL